MKGNGCILANRLKKRGLDGWKALNLPGSPAFSILFEAPGPGREAFSILFEASGRGGTVLAIPSGSFRPGRRGLEELPAGSGAGREGLAK